MSLGLTALELARIQFAFTVSFHIIFPVPLLDLPVFGSFGMEMVKNAKPYL